ncbi:MAG: type II toxin-antitoxin system RelE/ParE family toxin [Saprospiraceae bacterium]|nr:type II toxin-antitoxin system RelE/ParE family toxin [Saprospiraceae bacterium]
MKIIYKESFVNRFENQIDYIAQDNPSAAIKFRIELVKRIRNIPKNPLIHRKSIYFNENSIRDLIYKGYTIVFRINNDTIEVFGFVKFQEKPTD